MSTDGATDVHGGFRCVGQASKGQAPDPRAARLDLMRNQAE